MTELVGRAAAWLLPLMVFVTLAVVVLRYAFGEGSIILQESVMYMHALAFMLGIPYALKADAHVRVDLFYSRMGLRGRALVDLAGHLLALLPVAIVMILYSRSYVASAWRVGEGSAEVGGIPGVFLLKTLIPVCAVMLILQSIAEIARCLAALRNRSG